MHAQPNKNKLTNMNKKKKTPLQGNLSLKVCLLEDPQPAVTKTPCVYMAAVLCLCVYVGVLFGMVCTWFGISPT